MNLEPITSNTAKPELPPVIITQGEYQTRMAAPGVQEFTGTVVYDTGERLWLSIVRTCVAGVVIEMSATLRHNSSQNHQYGVVERARSPEEVGAYYLSIYGKGILTGGLCYDGADLGLARKMVTELALAASENRLFEPLEGHEKTLVVTAKMEVIDAAAGPREEFTVSCKFIGEYRPE